MSYYNMGIAAEVRMHQLLSEAEQGRLIRGIEPRHDHRAPRPSLRIRFTAAIRRVFRRDAAPAARTVVEGC